LTSVFTPTRPGNARSARRLATRVGVIALICSGLALLTPAAASASASAKPPNATRVSFGVAPANAHQPDGQAQFSFGVTPGAVLHDHVAVLNYSSIPLTLALYAADAVTTANGGFGLTPAGTRPTDVAAWITLRPGSATVRVPARTAHAPGSDIVAFTVHVPANATPGDHVGGILASLRTVGHNSSGQSVVLDQRVGSRVFVRVAGTLAPSLTITGLHTSYHSTLNPVGRGAITVSYVVHNTGNVALGFHQSVAASGVLGSSNHVALPAIALLLPGGSLHEQTQLNGLWPQFVEHTTVNLQPVAAPGGDPGSLSSVRATASVVAVPWALLVVLAAVSMALTAALIARRRRRRRTIAPRHSHQHARPSAPAQPSTHRASRSPRDRSFAGR
jgi:hypothetical protein